VASRELDEMLKLLPANVCLTRQRWIQWWRIQFNRLNHGLKILIDGEQCVHLAWIPNREFAVAELSGRFNFLSRSEEGIKDCLVELV
jgi:hypothetical protein